MPTTIQLPQIGESVVEGTIIRWLKNVGDSVKRWEPLLELETDKVNTEIPSPVSGVITRLLAQEGERIAMGADIAVVETGEAAAPAEAARRPTTPEELGYAGVGPTGSGGPALGAEKYYESPTPSALRQEPQPAVRERQRYSPVVRRLAQEHGVDLSQVKGTGMGGRITREDVLAHVQHQEAAPAAPVAEEEVLEPTPIRRTIAEHMVRSATTIPHVWSMVEADATGLVARRQAAKEEFQRREGVDLTYLPFVVKAVAEALKEHPLINSSWSDNRIVLKRRINIGIAVAAPQGLIVPVIHDADTMSIADLARAIADLITRSREARLTLADVQGGTFTINNTGALGSVVSYPLINYPQAAILTTEAIVKRAVILEGDAIAVRSIMNICLSFDHRILDGRGAGEFLQAVKHKMEDIGPDTPID